MYATVKFFIVLGWFHGKKFRAMSTYTCFQLNTLQAYKP